MKIGPGGYGDVYMGELNGDEIAVKKLFPVQGVNDESFDNEFRNLKKVRHKNVIRMIGYCYEILHRDVEYEEEIFHLDLKPDNVLLDDKLVPKIGDFGLSRLFGSSYTHQISTMKGTMGFIPQEYIHNRKVSPKNDVFSLGVLIFPMMAGANGYGDYWDARRRPNFSPKIQQEFMESVQIHWRKKMQETEDYRWDETDLLGVTKCLDMAMRCVEDDRDKRPSTQEIISEVKELDSKIDEMLQKDPKPLTVELRHKHPADELEVVNQNRSLNDLGRDIVVDPCLEPRFPFEPKKDISCCLQLTNKTMANYVAFIVNSGVNKYRAQPNKGILAPSQEEAPPNMQCLDVLVLKGIRVSEHFTSDEITQDFLTNSGAVDEVIVPFFMLH
ncbi:hypothetical protein VPH35_087596 [Triticum aestivum]